MHQLQVMLHPKADVTTVYYCPCIWEFVHLPSISWVRKVFGWHFWIFASAVSCKIQSFGWPLCHSLSLSFSLSENRLQPAQRKFCPELGLMKTDEGVDKMSTRWIFVFLNCWFPILFSKQVLTNSIFSKFSEKSFHARYVPKSCQWSLWFKLIAANWPDEIKHCVTRTQHAVCLQSWESCKQSWVKWGKKNTEPSVFHPSLLRQSFKKLD